MARQLHSISTVEKYQFQAAGTNRQPLPVSWPFWTRYGQKYLSEQVLSSLWTLVKEMQLSENNLLTTIGYGIQRPRLLCLGRFYLYRGNCHSVASWWTSLVEKIHQSLKNNTNSHNNDPEIYVPAFTGLGAPYWNQNARGSVFGLLVEQARLYQGNLAIYRLSSTWHHRHHASRCAGIIKSWR